MMKKGNYRIAYATSSKFLAAPAGYTAIFALDNRPYVFRSEGEHKYIVTYDPFGMETPFYDWDSEKDSPEEICNHIPVLERDRFLVFMPPTDDEVLEEEE